MKKQLLGYIACALALSGCSIFHKDSTAPDPTRPQVAVVSRIDLSSLIRSRLFFLRISETSRLPGIFQGNQSIAFSRGTESISRRRAGERLLTAPYAAKGWSSHA